MPLTFSDRQRGGLKGGRSTSAPKVKAAKQNAKLGGRPRGTVKRTLGEFLMRQKLNEPDYSWVHAGIFDLSRTGARGERYQFEKFFGVQVGGGVPVVGSPHWTKTTEYKQRHAAFGSTIYHIIRKFRATARKYRKKGY